MSLPFDSMVAIDKKLLANLPRTFVPRLNAQLKQWDLLFPAERRSLSATLDYLSALPAPEFRRLFAPVKKLEAKMALPHWRLSSEELRINETSVLARSRYFAQWRTEVEKIFAQINEHIEQSNDIRRRNKVILSVLPAGLPLHSGPFRPWLAKQGRWIELQKPFGETMEEFIGALAGRPAAPQTDPIEHTWALEYESHIAQISAPATLTALSYDSLSPVRRQFRKRLNDIRKDLRSADQAYKGLRRLNIARLLGPKLGADARVRQFARNLFLSGNGALIFGNSFIQWGAAEALRRVEPQALVCCFGIRQKLKPFSSLVLFEDQHRANPVPDQRDPAGSLIDIQVLCEYIYRLTDQLSSYHGRTLSLFAAAELNRMLLLAPPNFPPLPDSADNRLSPAQLADVALGWLASS